MQAQGVSSKTIQRDDLLIVSLLLQLGCKTRHCLCFFSSQVADVEQCIGVHHRHADFIHRQTDIPAKPTDCL